jgi:hypothetical protein
VADVDMVAPVTRELEARRALDAPVVESPLLTALPITLPDTDLVDDAIDDAMLLLELDAVVEDDAATAEDPDEEELEPVEVVSEASFAKPTAAGEYRYTLYTFFSIVSPTIHWIAEVEDKDCT